MPTRATVDPCARATPAFREAIEKNQRVAVPLLVVCRDHAKALVLGTLIAIATFVLFYLLTVFCLSLSGAFGSRLVSCK